MKSKKIRKCIDARNGRNNTSDSSGQKVTFTQMTSEEHKNTRVAVYPYLIP